MRLRGGNCWLVGWDVKDGHTTITIRHEIALGNGDTLDVEHRLDVAEWRGVRAVGGIPQKVVDSAAPVLHERGVDAWYTALRAAMADRAGT